MTIHPEPGSFAAAPTGPLATFLSCVSGSWRILARPGHLEVARSFLGPLPVESFLQALTEEESSSGPSPAGEVIPGPAGLPPVTREAASAGGGKERRAHPPGGRGATLELDCGGGTALVVKALKRGGLPARLRGGYHGASRMIAEMAILEEAALRGVPTTRLAFGATTRRSGGAHVSVIATELIPDAIRLGDLLASNAFPGSPEELTSRRKGDPRPTPAGVACLGPRRDALRASGAAVARAHDLGLDHADLNIGNILIRRSGGGWSAFVIDLGLSVLGPSLEIRRRSANLVRLLRSVEKHLGRDPRHVRDAVAFVQGYLSGEPAPHRHRRREELVTAVRRALPSVMIHRLGWRLTGRR